MRAVLAGATQEPVVAQVAEQRSGARAAVEPVATRPSVDAVDPPSAGHAVPPGAAVDRILPGPPSMTFTGPEPASTVPESQAAMTSLPAPPVSFVAPGPQRRPMRSLPEPPAARDGFVVDLDLVRARSPDDADGNHHLVEARPLGLDTKVVVAAEPEYLHGLHRARGADGRAGSPFTPWG